jgi:putative transposase
MSGAVTRLSLSFIELPPCPAEAIHRRAPWHNVEAVELATLERIDWFNHRRLLEPIGDIPPVEFEQAYYRRHESHALAA